MEGSVRSLIEAEEEARKIVEQAQQEKLSKVKEADTTAQQIINQKQQAFEAIFREEEIKVIVLNNILLIERIRESRASQIR